MKHILNRVRNQSPERKQHIARILALGVTVLVAIGYITIRIITAPDGAQSAGGLSIISDTKNIIQAGVQNFNENRQELNANSDGWFNSGNAFTDFNPEYENESQVVVEPQEESSVNNNYDESNPFIEETDTIEPTLYEDETSMYTDVEYTTEPNQNY